MVPESFRRDAPLFLAMALVGTILGGLLVGYEPVGGDPDRMYRPLKSELARALEEGRLPFWSDRLGVGLPLVAESHVAAFYPPNLVLYRFLGVPAAYRLSMWLHYLALAAATYFYARCLEILPWGAALAALAFTFCGFQAIHSSHEPFYCLMPYLPLALGIAERFMASGRPAWFMILPLVLGMQWTLGHFQIQTWTAGWSSSPGSGAGRRSSALEASNRPDLSGRLGSRAGRRPARAELAVRRTGRTNPACGQRPALLLVSPRELVRAGLAPAGP